MNEQPEPLTDEEVSKMLHLVEQQVGHLQIVERRQLLALLVEVQELRQYREWVESQPPTERA